ncbi:unnamed protein product, partial [marine sediment metagenome]
QIAGATTLERGVSPAIESENLSKLEEAYRIKIENVENGAVAVSEDQGDRFQGLMCSI